MLPLRSRLAKTLLVVITAAASAEPINTPTLYQNMSDDKPSVGSEATVSLGDRMFEQRQGEYRDCIVPKSSFSKSMNLGMARFIVKSGGPICKRSVLAKQYTPNYPNFGSESYDVVLVNDQIDKVKLCITQYGIKAGCIGGIDDTLIVRGPWFVYESNSFQQSIEYAGRSGAMLKFIYAEYKDGFARQAFTRDFQIDMNEGKIVAYKGAKIEIIQATNVSITYKVLTNFR